MGSVNHRADSVSFRIRETIQPCYSNCMGQSVESEPFRDVRPPRPHGYGAAKNCSLEIRRSVMHGESTVCPRKNCKPTRFMIKYLYTVIRIYALQYNRVLIPISIPL